MKAKLVVSLLALLAMHAAAALAAVNVNTATVEQLEKLDGIGPVKARAIVDHRRKHGFFKTLEEVKNVPGIGEDTFRRIRKEITLTGRTTDPAKAGERTADAKRPEQKK